jgi:hypothetical protein
MFAASKEFVIITMRKGLAAAGVVALIAAGSAACGTAQATPQGKVQNALTKVSGQKSLTLGLSFDATPDQIYAAMKDQSDFTQADATMLAALHLKVAVSSQQQFSLLNSAAKAGAGAFEFQLANDAAGKENLIEIRSIDKKVYLRADLKALQKLDTSSDGAALNDFLNQADQLPSSLASLKAAVKGEWVVIDPKAFMDYAKSMADQFGGSADSSSGSGGSLFPGLPATPKVDAKTQQQLVAAVRKALAHNATYKALPDRDGAGHVQVSVPAKQLATELKTSLTPILQQIPDFSASDLNGLDDVPNRVVSVDVGVKGGSLSSITFDLAQLDKTITGKLPLALTLDSHAAGISAPAGAKQVNPQDIMGLFMAGMPGTNDTSTYSAGTSAFSVPSLQAS